LFSLSYQNQCDLYLAPSTLLGAGRGIIAGRDFPNDYIVETVPSLSIDGFLVGQSQLINYVFERYHNHESMVVFGSGSIYNSVPVSDELYLKKDVEHLWTEPGQALAPESWMSKIAYQIVLNDNSIEPNRMTKKKGYEIFTTYGNDWFTSRQLLEDRLTSSFPPIQLTEEELHKFGICLSDIYVSDSLEEYGGIGIFARRRFTKGEVITVSPVVSLSRKLLARRIEEMVNSYLISSRDSDLLLFPVTSAAYINHAYRDKAKANAAMTWFNWAVIPGINSSYAYYLRNIIDGRVVLERTTDQLIHSPFAQLDIAYIATKNIEENEEILLDYGEDWENAWENYQQLCAYNSLKKEIWKRELPNCQFVFREYIEAPEGMYPNHWYT
jgi:hypothetical protein